MAGAFLRRVKQSSRTLIRIQVASTVRSAAFLELDEDLLDRVEILAVGRQEEQICAGGADGATDGLAFVIAEVVDMSISPGLSVGTSTCST
nr:hypothetical protein [Bradyrhizobium elkanii]